jgi:phosphatidylglycerophosphate synthase
MAGGNNPVVIVATRDEAAGARLRVAGLLVVERAVKQLGRMKHAPIIVATDGSVEVPAGAEARRVANAAEAEALAAELGARTVRADVVRPAGGTLEGGVRVTDRRSRREAEDAVFRQLLRGDLGFVARWFNKPISFRITRYLLCRLPFTPNQVTVAAAFVGFVGCALIAYGTYASMVAGFALAHLQSVLDGCDGELARVRFQMTPIGEWLDTLFDDALNLGLWASTGIGLWRHTGEPGWAYAGFAGCAMLLTYNFVSYMSLVKQKLGGELLKVKWWFSRKEDLKQVAASRRASLFNFFFMLGRRDFFVLAWLLMAIGGVVQAVMATALLISVVQFTLSVGQIVYVARSRT